MRYMPGVSASEIERSCKETLSYIGKNWVHTWAWSEIEPHLAIKWKKWLMHCSMCNTVVQSLSHVQFFVTPWTVALQASLSMRFSKQQVVWISYSWRSPLWDGTHVSCIGRLILYHWATREAPCNISTMVIYTHLSFRGKIVHATAAAKSFQSFPSPRDPIDGSPPGSPVPRILQARTLEWVSISFSNAWKWKVKVKSLSSVQLVATPWTAAYQAPPSMAFSRQEDWSGVPLPSPNGACVKPKELSFYPTSLCCVESKGQLWWSG